MNFAKSLEEILPVERIRSRYIDLVSFASDAGFYQLIPKVVVQPQTEKEIIGLFAFSQNNQIPLVFRTGGTSVSGQCITDGILVDLSQFWNKITIEENGDLVRVQPGITGALVNARLQKYGRKIGPDPASINSAMMGGILSNNSSGMCCGVVNNSYHTTQQIQFILPNGNSFNTEEEADYSRFEEEENQLFDTLKSLRKQILDNSELLAKIKAKYKTKNTVGYALNALVDYKQPLDIFAHLLIGAEGTLAFISEATLNTIPDYPFKATALLFFPDIFTACQTILPLKEAGAMTVELMDTASLRAVQNMEGMPDFTKNLEDGVAAFLVEFHDKDQEGLQGQVDRFLEASSSFTLLSPTEFTTDAKQQAALWKIRKGLFPAVGAVRKSGTSVLLEDITIPIEKLGHAIIDLQSLFKKHEYENAIIFGHAKDGNIHFVVTQAFNQAEEVARYDRFLKDMIDLVINRYDGSLKAEHGTGRNMAPFVATEWGDEAYDIMKTIKEITDPHNILNPGVIINSDKEAHIKHLKKLPVVEEEVDKCIECGFCEHVCPSKDLTTTPRRRIVIRRALETLKAEGNIKNYNLLLDQYQYDGSDTCAVDGLCATACPVDINTGDLTKRLRSESHSALANKVAFVVAKNFGLAEQLAKMGLNTGNLINKTFGKNAMYTITKGLRKLSKAIPLWSDQLASSPSATKQLKANDGIVYFPACISRMMGKYPNKDKNLMETFLSVCQKVNIDVSTLEGLTGTCCGQIFSSKGYQDAYKYNAEKIIDKLWLASDKGRKPIVIDVSSCAYTLHQLESTVSGDMLEKYKTLKILDSVDFLCDMVVPKVSLAPKNKKVVLHPVCSLKKMKTEDKFIKVAKHFANDVTVPAMAGCCGMAGDRGFLVPQLTAAATKLEAWEVNQSKYDGYYSSTKTCEMAMSDAVKANYESILYLVDEGI